MEGRAGRLRSFDWWWWTQRVTQICAEVRRRNSRGIDEIALEVEEVTQSRVSVSEEEERLSEWELGLLRSGGTHSAKRVSRDRLRTALAGNSVRPDPT